MRKKITLRGRFMRTLILFSVLTLILWFGYHQVNYSAVRSVAEENTRLVADNLTAQISAEFAQMRTITSAIAGSSYIQEFLSEKDVTAYYEKAGIASEIIQKAAFPITSADNVLAINADGVTYRFSGGLSSQSCEALYKSIAGAGTVYTVVELDKILYYCHSAPVFSMAGQSHVRLGSIAMLTGLERTRRTLDHEDSQTNMDIAVVFDGVIIMSSNPSLEGVAADELYARYGMVTTALVDGTPLSIAAAIPKGELDSRSALFMFTSLAFIGLLFLMIAVLYRFLSRDMIKPMTSVVADVASLDGGQYRRLAELPVIGKPDFESLVNSINEMLERTEKYYTELTNERQKVFDAELARQKMRMGLLAMQMDAHFVANTLIGIKSLAVRGDNEQAAQMAEGLGFLIRQQHKGDMPVNVFTEFMVLDKYIEVIKIRYSDEFSYDYDLDDRLSGCVMPGFILQPVVENSVEHGLREKTLEQGARLFIKGVIQDGKVHIEVSDTGAGIPPGKLKAIQESLASAEPQDFPEPGLRGVALMNIQRRIRLQFGNEYGVGIESDFGKGTTVTLSFPLILEQEPCEDN